MEDGEAPNQGTKPIAVGRANKSVCQDKATLIFPLEKSCIGMIIILYNLEIYLFISLLHHSKSSKKTQKTQKRHTSPNKSVAREFHIP